MPPVHGTGHGHHGRPRTGGHDGPGRCGLNGTHGGKHGHGAHPRHPVGPDEFDPFDKGEEGKAAPAWAWVTTSATAAHAVHAAAPSLYDILVQRCDLDGDRRITEEEVTAGPFAMTLGRDFATLDSDGDGVLSAAEVAAYVARPGGVGGGLRPLQATEDALDHANAVAVDACEVLLDGFTGPSVGRMPSADVQGT